MDFQHYLDRVFYDNSLRQWSIALAIALALFCTLLLARGVVAKRLGAVAERTTTVFDDVVVALDRRTRLYFLVALAVMVASRFLTLSATVDRYIATGFTVVLLMQLGVWGTTVVGSWAGRLVERRSANADAVSASTIRALSVAAKILLWTVLVIMALAKFDVDVSALVTGLGIGGVAIALAVQNILGDLFAALSIVFDKPFDVGDFIVLDQTGAMGTVEHIGLKTTRLRSLSGEQIVVSNSELLKNRIRNFKRMYERRVVFTMDVTYDTSADLMARIPAMIREVVTSQQRVRFDRSHFSTFTDSALRLETVYFVLDPDYNRFMDIQQSINIELLRRFGAEGIQFAFPTRTVQLVESCGAAETPARQVEETIERTPAA
jgi:small-conductance mechanosensitive channel